MYLYACEDERICMDVCENKEASVYIFMYMDVRD